MTIDGTDLDCGDLVDRVRLLASDPNPGFTRYNTLVLVASGEAFVPAGSGRTVKDGERVALIPFSHGG